MTKSTLKIISVRIDELKVADYNPRRWDAEAEKNLSESIKQFGVVDPLLVNSAPERKGVVIGGHFRLAVLKKLGYTEVPVVYISIPNRDREKELNLRLNKNTGEFDWDMLAKFDEKFLSIAGFSSEELDDIFAVDPTPEQFDLQKELDKMGVEVKAKKGDIYEINGSRLMVGDSTVEADMLKLMGKERADMCFTDPPYILDYLKGKDVTRYSTLIGRLGLRR